MTLGSRRRMVSPPFSLAGENGGAKVFALEVGRCLAAMALLTRLVLLT